MLLLSVNQTILFALSMVVIAGLIGGQGLGDVVTSGLYSNPALAFLAGAAIVIMAIALDRATEAMANRTDPAHRHLDRAEAAPAPPLHARRAPPASASRSGSAHAFGAGSIWTRSTAQDWLLRQVQSALDYVQNPYDVRLPHHEPDRELHRAVRARAAAAASSSRRRGRRCCSGSR